MWYLLIFLLNAPEGMPPVSALDIVKTQAECQRSLSYFEKEMQDYLPKEQQYKIGCAYVPFN